MSHPLDRRVVIALQALVVGLPLFLGGRQSTASFAAALLVLGLLAVTLRERRRRGGGPHAPGVGALAAFVALALATTLPLPPSLIQAVSPSAARLYGDMLPGWPAGGGWSLWRSLAIDPYAVWVELGHFAIGLGVFAVVVAYPWEDTPAGESGRLWVFGRLVLTLIGAGVLMAALGLVEQVAGNGNVLWVSDIPTASGRISGPFVNPNHFAAWLEMIIPVGIAYTVALVGRVRRRVVQSARAGQGMGVSMRRAWVSALVTHQQRLWEPLLCLTAVLVMASAHVMTGSRGGTAALCAGLGIAGVGMLTTRRSSRAAWLPGALAGALLVASVLFVVGWGALEGAEETAATVDAADVSLGSRLAVSAHGWGVVRDYPVAGTGLGTWLHAFRPYVAPPIEGGIWDHAHNDYLELTAETGIAGALLVLLFTVGVVRALRRGRPATGADRPDAGPARGFARRGWYAALTDAPHVRWGLAGGVAAILVHSVVDFSLRMPANLLLAMVVLGLLVVSGRPQPGRGAPAVAGLLVVLGAALLPRVANFVLPLAGGMPLSPAACRTTADLLLAEEGDEGRERALALLHRALEGSPADRDTHQQLAEALGPGPDGDAALRRALALEPWAVEVRDQLAQRLLERGQRAEAAAELEESMYRFPHLASHAFLTPDLDAETGDPARVVRALANGDPTAVRLAELEPEVADALARGLERALDEAAGSERALILNDAAALLEARERWREAAEVLHAEADRSEEGGTNLARAARDYLKAKEHEAAERSLLAAVLRTPENGDLYRSLAVDVYAARHDFDLAESVLDAGEQNAVDLLPVYAGVIEVLKQRESARDEQPPWAAPSPAPIEELVP